MTLGTYRWARQDMTVVLAGFLLLLAWDMSTWDLAVMHSMADANGFPWRHHWLTSLVLHEGGRWLSWGILLALLLEAVFLIKTGPTRQKRFAYLLGMVACALLVPLIKRLNSTSCPWDLTDFWRQSQLCVALVVGRCRWRCGALFPFGACGRGLWFFRALFFVARP
jgi:membrane-associated PAP2 superfamily phosphatase